MAFALFLHSHKITAAQMRYSTGTVLPNNHAGFNVGFKKNVIVLNLLPIFDIREHLIIFAWLSYTRNKNAVKDIRNSYFHRWNWLQTHSLPTACIYRLYLLENREKKDKELRCTYRFW